MVFVKRDLVSKGRAEGSPFTRKGILSKVYNNNDVGCFVLRIFLLDGFSYLCENHILF